MPRILAIETSQRKGGVALRDSAGNLHIEPLRADKRHDDDLMPAVERLMERAGLRPGELEAVGVSVGPGGFTGLRIAVSAAKVIALTRDLAVVQVPSALVAAESLEAPAVAGGPVLVALASKRGSVWAARVLRRDRVWTILGRPELVSGDEVPLEDVTALVGDRHLPQSLRARAEAANVPVIEPRFDPAQCLVVCERLLAAGQTVDPRILSPLYPRPPEAVSLWEKRRQR